MVSRAAAAPSRREFIRDAALLVASCATPTLRAADPVPVAKVKEETRDVAGKALEQKEEWHTSETANFIIHVKDPNVAPSVANTVEVVRTASRERLLAVVDQEAWKPKCKVYIYANADEYGKKTNMPSDKVPAHSNYMFGPNGVLSRDIHAYANHPGLIPGVLPHEVTHTVLVGKVKEGGPTPRWVDEAAAIHAEPAATWPGHLGMVHKLRQERGVYSLRELLTMKEYPVPLQKPKEPVDPAQEKRNAQAQAMFYAQSVSVYNFLRNKGREHTIISFARDGEKDGYEAAAKKHYGKTLDELALEWKAFAFPGN